MQVLLKFAILCAWLLFFGALWQMHRTPAHNLAGRSLPVSGLLSISRKITNTQVSAQMLPEPASVAWPAADLYLTIPATGF